MNLQIKKLMFLPENLSVLRLRHFIPLKYIYTYELKILFNLFKKYFRILWLLQTSSGLFLKLNLNSGV